MKNTKHTTFEVIGPGRFGTTLTKDLAEADKEVIVVDCNEGKVRGPRHYMEYTFVTKNLTKETLEDIGIQNCDTVVICIGEKIDTSILTALNVVSLGIPQVIAKTVSRDQGAVLEKIGMEVVYPERDTALRLGKRLVSSSFLDYISLDSEVKVQQIPVASKMVGMTIQEFNIRQKYGLNIVTVERGHVTDIEVSPRYHFGNDSVIVVIGRVEGIKRFESSIED